MTERQILLVKNSWSYIVINAEEAGELFYQHLFEIAPGVRHLFKGEIKAQAKKLMSMVTYIVTRLQNLESVTQEIRSLAQRHNKYGTQPAHYAVVGECLLWTLEHGMAEKWNQETKDAWTAAYAILSNAMIEGQAATAHAA